MNGVVVVDKPTDMTSAQVVARVKRFLKARKVGHTGTLDPFATGVLVCCVNHATRLARFISQGRKHYDVVMKLGVRTDTQDFTGRVLSTESIAGVTDEKIEMCVEKMIGESRQMPPSFSALKHQGKPLYQLAREGVFVQKPPRPIRVDELTVLKIDPPMIHFRVVCTSGTYVRTLCADMGELLGCGAHLLRLRRTQSGGFTLRDAVSLDTLESLAEKGEAEDALIPMERALKEVPEVQVGNRIAAKIRNGTPLTEKDVGRFNGGGFPWVKVIDMNRKLIAVLDAKKRKDILPYMCVFANEDEPDYRARAADRE